MNFSVVIPTCERNDALAACLARLAPGRQTLGGEKYEVIVTDDGHRTTAVRMIEDQFPWAKWTRGPRRGPAANRNHGASLARGEWLVFTDDDCLPAPEWLAAWEAAQKHAPLTPVWEGRTLALGERRSIDTEAPVNVDGGYLWSCNFAMRRAWFDELGGFDPVFANATMEDVDLRTRLRKRGVSVGFAPDALVHHPWRRRKGGRHLRDYVRSVDAFVAKHPEEAENFSLPSLTRGVSRQLWRNTRDGLRNFRGRGVARMLGIELHVFLLLAWHALRR